MSWGSTSTARPASSAGWGSPAASSPASTRPVSSTGWGASTASSSWGTSSPATSSSGWGNSPAASSPATSNPTTPAASRVAPSQPATSSSGWGNSSPAASPASQPAKPAAATGGWGASSSSAGGGGWGSTSSWGASGGWGNSSASSWANTQAKSSDQPTNDSWAKDVMQAGTQAYEAYVDEMREKEDVSVTTDRMKRLCQETDEIANSTIDQLKDQNEKMDHLEDEMAEVHDMLNTSEKKMKQIKSFWGGWSTIGSSKTHDQHQKMRAKNERHRLKDMEHQAHEDEKLQAANDKVAVRQNKDVISQHVHDNKKAIHNGKKESMAEAKAINKGKMDLAEEKQVWAGHVFETRIDGSGPKHQAEQDLDDIGGYISGFHEKALLMSQLVDESTDSTKRVNAEVERATARTQALNKQADRYCGKK